MTAVALAPASPGAKERFIVSLGSDQRLIVWHVGHAETGLATATDITFVTAHVVGVSDPLDLHLYTDSYVGLV